MDRELLQRVAALEVQVSKMQLAFGSIRDGIVMAEQHTVACVDCGLDPGDLDVCIHEECPCGVPYGENPND